MCFVGYCDESKGYRLINPKNPKSVIITRNVHFIETTCNDKSVNNNISILYNDNSDMKSNDDNVLINFDINMNSSVN